MLAAEVGRSDDLMALGHPVLGRSLLNPFATPALYLPPLTHQLERVRRPVVREASHACNGVAYSDDLTPFRQSILARSLLNSL